MVERADKVVGRPRLPEWLKVRAPGSPRYLELKQVLRGSQLHTVCEAAHCPNIGECWEWGTATFMILGDICTRYCHYCAVSTGRPTGIDLQEPGRLAETVRIMGLRFCVITSVNRDDLPDGGAFIFASSIKKIRRQTPGCKIEVLIPDFEGSWTALEKVVDARPEVLNHNIESARRIFPKVRPRGDYRLSLELLARAKQIDPATVTKSGIIVGMGESTKEVLETMEDLRAVGCDLLTIGQYLRPSTKHLPVARFYAPDEFAELREAGEAMGFKHVASGPLVRSSYHAGRQHSAAITHAAEK
ncbi:MAG: lipoyl synthase [Dehalococcoidia bacterium]|jgi:lipoic acid synthetase|nr:lipoyl synthase [Dehalococcoidia bacterium]